MCAVYNEEDILIRYIRYFNFDLIIKSNTRVFKEVQKFRNNARDLAAVLSSSMCGHHIIYIRLYYTRRLVVLYILLSCYASQSEEY